MYTAETKGETKGETVNIRNVKAAIGSHKVGITYG
jgi:hypothetical protein